MALEPMSPLGWLVIGAVAGWLAGRIVEGGGFGLIGNVVIGILGARVGGFILPRLGIIPESTLGAVILLFVLGLLQRA